MLFETSDVLCLEEASFSATVANVAEMGFCSFSVQKEMGL